MSFVRRDEARAGARALLAVGVAALALALLPGADASHGQAPQCAIGVSGPAGDDSWWTGAVTVTLTPGAGVTSTTYVLDGARFTYQGPFTVWADGVHALDCEVTGHDDATASYSRAIAIDSQAPTCAGAYSGGPSTPSGWHLAHGAYALSASDAGSGVSVILVRLDGGAWSAYAGPLALGDGRHVVECVARDAAGHDGAFTALVNVDASPPTSCRIARVHDPARGVDAPPTGGWFGVTGASTRGARVYLGADDAGSGASLFHVLMEGASHSVPNGSSFPVHGEGARTLSCRVQDEAGHEATFQVPLRIDGTRPTCRGAYTGTPGTSNWHRTGAFALTADDALSGVAYLNWTLDGAPRTATGEPPGSSARVEVTAEGVRRVTCTATDRAGLASATGTFTVRLDTTPPACAISFAGAEGANGWRPGPVLVFANATDAASGVASARLSTRPGEDVPYAGPVEVSEEGARTVSCRATDAAGNAHASEAALRIDRTPPKLCVGAARAADGRPLEARGGWYARALDFELSTRDEASGLASASVRLDGRPVPGVPQGGAFSNVTLRIDERGEHVVECAATDLAGNAAPPLRLVVSVDDVLPSCAGETRGDARGGWLRGAASVALSASDQGSGLESVRYRLDGGPERDYVEPIPLEGDGNHRVECVARDAAGNEATRVLDLRVDATPPDCAWAPEVDADAVLAGPARVEVVARDATSGVAGVRVRLNGGAFAPYAGPFELAGAGVHEVACLVEDEAGNEREVLLPRLRVEEPAREVRPAAVPPARDAVARTAQPVPVPGAALAAAALAGAAWLAACRKA